MVYSFLVYTYLSGAIIVFLLPFFVKWIRPENTHEVLFHFLLVEFSWITIFIILYVLYKEWKEDREIIKNLPNEN